jgi:rhamnose utilization protein RhaD (predicted bifunctional aldolase and dehydrogenase)/NAD(P)-dependent dehydrogenase (short-subunit alcohol dehydrogenase family)
VIPPPGTNGGLAPGPWLDDILELSRSFGSDPDFSRGGGGNSSVKVGDVLYIKPSGLPLAALTAQALIALNLAPLTAFLNADRAPDGPGETTTPGDASGPTDAMEVALSARMDPTDDRRPSVEFLFHALLPERFVLHTHPTDVNAITCSADGAGLADRLFGDRALWVPYTDPGLPLARAIRDTRASFEARTRLPAPKAVLLQNHGLIVCGDSASEVSATSASIVSAVRARLAEPAGEQAPARAAASAEAPAPSGGAARATDRQARVLIDALGPALRALLATGDRLKVVTFDDSPLAVEMASSSLGGELARSGPLTPDQIVYAGSWPLLLADLYEAGSPDIVARLEGAIAGHRRDHGVLPTIVLAPGLGLFAAGESYRQADTARHTYLDAMRVARGAGRLGGVRPLAPAERSFIERWEAEEYRRTVDSGIPAAGRVRGLVAVVTGAAQGFGLAIARDLVAQGAHVVLADINATPAETEAGMLTDEFGAGRAVGLQVDVTDEGSVGDCFHEVVRRYGGFDLLVSNAGMLRAGRVTSQPLAEFDAVTRVNYRGYFLCVRYAAPILARQHEARPAYWSDIVEINSKSGLVGSSRNSAYAGSKFGGVGLTQSFALELVGDGIKVNAICPGNFLDGPLWADPENGLLVQYLREGKVPGATSVDDVRRFYEAKVPMGRGCTPADVLEALYYVVAQQYETGQALPVTGGQVMLS